MSRYTQRSSLRPHRGLVVLVLFVGALVGAAFWIGPFRPIPAELRLFVQNGDSLAAIAAVPAAGAAGQPRFPLVLGMSNAGGRVAEPVHVDLSVPATFRVHSNGVELRRQSSPGNPLVRYRVPIAARAVAPDSQPHLLGIGDTLWLEPVLHTYYCTALADSIPEFVPAPARDPEQLARLQVFYSFAERTGGGRQTGVLQLALDPAALAVTPAAMPPLFPTQVREPQIVGPALGTLSKGGERTAQCGDPQQPIDVYSVLWETPARGRFIVVYVSVAPRKQLYDLNRDSIVELEMWDPDADGRFEAARAARYPIPSFLLPERSEEVVAVDSLLADPQWQRLFGDTLAGPFRFVPDSLLHPALRAPQLVTDSAWLSRFHDVGAGPYRFAENPPARLVKPPEPPPVRRRGPVPLGRPIPYPPPGRPDTLRRSERELR